MYLLRQPLYYSAPFAASQDADLYLLLGLVDLVRCEDLGQREKASVALEKYVRDFHARGRALPEEQVVLANLSDLGAPLVFSEETATVKNTLPREETISAALTLAHQSEPSQECCPLYFINK